MSDEWARSKAGWEGRYQAGPVPWDLGAAPPALDAEIAALSGGALRVLVPGAGFGHDAVAWARAGHRVTMVDIAPSAVAGARALARSAGVALQVLEADIFELPGDLEGFDVVWEHTCLCALPPARRPDYGRLAAGWLVPGGRLLALLWNHGQPGGPPYDITPELAREVFDPHLDFEGLEPVRDSAPGRAHEFLLRLRRREEGRVREARSDPRAGRGRRR